MKFTDIKPVYEAKTTQNSDAFEDGELIAEIVIEKHGLGTERFKKLTFEQQLYVEELLCSIIQTLSSHLSELISIRLKKSEDN